MPFKKLKKLIKKVKTKKTQKRLTKLTGAGKVKRVTNKGKVRSRATKQTVTKKAASVSGKVRKSAVSAKKTQKGGYFPEYKKKSKAAGSFRAAFKKAGGKNFEWDGRKYSGKKAAPKAKKKKQ